MITASMPWRSSKARPLDRTEHKCGRPQRVRDHGRRCKRRDARTARRGCTDSRIDDVVLDAGLLARGAIARNRPRCRRPRSRRAATRSSRPRVAGAEYRRTTARPRRCAGEVQISSGIDGEVLVSVVDQLLDRHVDRQPLRDGAEVEEQWTPQRDRSRVGVELDVAVCRAAHPSSPAQRG